MRDEELENTVNDVVRKLAQVRVEQNMTLADLSRLTGLHYTAISKIESGERQPTLLTILKLAKHLKISIRDLISD